MFDLKLIVLPPSGEAVSPKYSDIEVENYDLVTLDGVKRKTQDIIKILLTRIGSNLLYPNYGSELPDVFGTRATPQVVDTISSSIVKAMGYLQQIETSNKPEERVRSIVSLNVVDGTDPRTKIIRLIVDMEDGSIATTNIPVSPGG